VGLVVALLLPPLWILLLLLSRDEAAGFRLVRSFTRTALRLAGCRIRVLHGDRVPSDRPVMLVSNHVSIADAVVLLAALPLDFRFVANHVYARYPLLGAAVRRASANIVDRGSWRSRGDSGKAMVDALSSGRSLLVFPEGTTSDTDAMLPFRSGAFRAAARTACPVVPIALRGTRHLFPNHGFRLANVPIEIELLLPLRAADASRQAAAELQTRTVDAVTVALTRAKTSSARSTP
jgi:1-acyl-sn-glycerol-3-phosphate acyltransferase